MMASKLAKLTPREKNGLILAGLAALAVASDFLVIRPIAVRFGRLKADVRFEENRLKVNQKALSPSRKRAIEQEYGKYGALIQKRRASAEESAAILSEIETLAAQCRITLVGSKPREPKSMGYYEEHQVEIETEAEFPDFARFLYGLETSPHLLRVARLECSPKNRDQPSLIRSTLAVTKIVAL